MSRFRALTAIVGLVAVALAVPATAGPNRVPVLTSGAALSVVRDGLPALSSPIRALVPEPGARDLGSKLRAVAQAAALASDGQQRALPLGAARSQEDESNVELSSYFFGYALPAGDLDGDGTEDLLAYGPTPMVQALSGADGALLWERAWTAEGGLGWPALTDLTGDGRPDLVFLEGRQDGTYHLTETGSRYYGTSSYVLSVVRGADGQLMWDRPVDGSFEEIESTTYGRAGKVTYEYSVTSTNDPLLPLVTPDVTGDGAADVIVTEVDVDFTDRQQNRELLLARTSSHDSSLRSSARAYVLDGPSGSRTVVKDVVDEAGIPLLLPARDAVGNAVADLLWVTERAPLVDRRCVAVRSVERCRDDSSGALEALVEIIDGATRTTEWNARVPGAYPYVRLLDGDADGDGINDVTVQTYLDGNVTTLLSASTGKQLWALTKTERVEFLLGIEPDERGPVAVVLRIEGQDDELPGAGWTVVVERRSAGDGAVLSEHEQRLPDAEGDFPGSAHTSLLVDVIGDGDGDGGRELLLSSMSEAFRDGERVFSSSWSGSDLSDGRNWYNQESNLGEFVREYGDLDGDGLTDLAIDQYGQNYEPTLTTAFRALNNQTLWQITGSAPRPLAAGDLDGRPGQELLTFTNNGQQAVLRTHHGADLRHRWSYALQ